MKCAAQVLILLLCILLSPRPSEAILCEIFEPCRYISPDRFIFLGTVEDIKVRQHDGWLEAEEIAFLRIDEAFSGTAPRRQRLGFLNTNFKVGESYIVVATEWRDGYYVDWHGDDYRGFQTAVVCGPSFPVSAPTTDEYASYFRNAMKQPRPVDHEVWIFESPGETEVDHALIHLLSSNGNYVAEADDEGEAVFKAIPPGTYRWEVWQGDRRFDPDKETSREIKILPGSCDVTMLDVVPRK